MPALREQEATACARNIVQAFHGYNTAFRAITQRAPQRFQARDWKGSLRDAVERIELYERYVNATIAILRLQLGEALDRTLWREVRRQFPALIENLPDREFVKTFFSSITRRLFDIAGVEPDLEFVALDLDPLAGIDAEVITHAYLNRGSLELLVEQVLADFHLRTAWRDFDRSVAHVKSQIEGHCREIGERRAVERIELLRPVFYQMTRAYLVGSASGRGWRQPLVIALKNTEGGMLVDAVMMRESDVSIVFSFTRSYFHVDLERVGEAVVFLKSLLPRKPVSELFTVLGRVKQGKTERYRELFRHLHSSGDRFVPAPGERGLVMLCFTLPSFDIVFKVIRDCFRAPKQILRQEVMAKYELVFKHDRAGRLVDAQEFRQLRFPRGRFAPDLLMEIEAETAGSVHPEGEDLIFEHLYIERRLTPLNLYLREQPREKAEAAVLDYGQCVRDLAYTNIFAGDLLLKNFGVTRHGRVIFYDYDELCLVTDCRFRELPQARHDEDELRAEAWFYVADNDVFPETFIRFLGLDEPLRRVLLEVHGEIFTARFWQSVQRRHLEGELMEVLPYHPRPRSPRQTA